MKKILTILTTISIVVTCLAGSITALAEVYEPAVTEAIVADSNDAGRSVHGTYTVSLDGTTVDIDMDELAYHQNGEGTMGYWTGFAVVAPDTAAKVKYTFGDTTDGVAAAEDIDQNGTMGVAFYTDAANPDTEVTFQWLDSEENVLTEEITLTMDLADVNYYGVGEVEPAIIADSDDAEVAVYSDYEVTEAEGVVTIITTDLAKHTNGAGNEGYWTGFAVVAPDAYATKVKYTFGETTDGIALVEDIDQEGTLGIAFYTNAGSVTPNTEVTLQWLNEAEEVLSSPITYTIDLSHVTLNTGYTLEVTEAVVADSDDAVAVVYSDYEVTEAEGIVTITMTDLAKHTNGAGNEEYWTGFAVVAPASAAYGKYTFGESTGTALEDIAQNGTDGIAFYTNAIDPVTEVELQWFDIEGNALSNVITLEMILDVTYEGAVDITAADVTEAIIADKDDADASVYASYSVDATDEDGKIEVAISNSGLKAHKNGTGEEGYWTGFAVKAPDDATQAKYTFGDSGNIVSLEDIDQNGTMGIAFYTNVDDAKTEVTLQWFDENGDPVSNVATFEIDLSGVNKYTAPTPTRGGSVSTKYYTVTFDTDGGNKISAVSVKENNVLNKPADPKKDGFTFAGWYTDKALTTEYDFSSKVTKVFTLYAKWEEATEEDKEDATTTKGFTDIAEDAWYYDVVTEAIEKGLMNGMSETEFAPQASLTRGMFVSILYRLAGEPEVTGECQFADVAADMYYTNAVIWATTNGIVNGITEDTFAPESNITREQMATIIHRYAEYAKIEIEEGEDVTYTDSEFISDYAAEAIKWAKWAGLLNGNEDGSFAPQRNSTRAEAAALFVRLLGVIE